MEELTKVDFSFKNPFVPLTTIKEITIIFIIGFIVYGNCLFNGFVQDDNYQIGPSISLRSINDIFLFFKGSTFVNIIPGQTIGVYYKPLLVSLFSALYSIFGNNAFPFHLLQLLFYILNTCLVFFLLQHFLKRQLSFLLSLIFLVHPINSEVSLYIANTQEVLFLFCVDRFGKVFTNVDAQVYIGAVDAIFIPQFFMDTKLRDLFIQPLFNLILARIKN